MPLRPRTGSPQASTCPSPRHAYSSRSRSPAGAATNAARRTNPAPRLTQPTQTRSAPTCSTWPLRTEGETYMQITRNETETGNGPGDWFTGTVYIDTIAAPGEASTLGAAAVHFTPG